eukprot:m.78288 g.78288  ORF g.78288 m.78288 type:complete len:346 (+) comp9205_c0_seq2:266-1303(+)
MATTLTLLAGNASNALAKGIAAALDTPLAPTKVGVFANGETSVSVGLSVREADVFVIQSGVGDIRTNDAVMEMLILVNASRIASAQRVTLVVPYFPYAKQNKIKRRGAVPARLMADLMKVAGAMHVITVDLNPAQMAGFFHVPVDNIMMWPLMEAYIKSLPDYINATLVAKNAGASKRASKLAKMLDLNIAMMIDRLNEEDWTVADTEGSATGTDPGAPGPPEVACQTGTIIGKVKGRVCIVVDDVLDDAEPFMAAAKVLMAAEAAKVIVMVTHGVLAGDSPQKLQDCPHISHIVVTNTIPQEKHQAVCKKLKVIRCERNIAEAIRRVHNDECMSSKFSMGLELA